MKKLILIATIALLASCSKNTTTTTNNGNTTPTKVTKGWYTINSKTYAGKCITDNKGYVFIQDSVNTNNSFGINQMPNANSGNFSFGKNFSGDTVSPMGYILSNGPEGSFGSLSGNITKSGARKFEFTAILYEPTKPGITFSITGGGEY